MDREIVLFVCLLCVCMGDDGLPRSISFKHFRNDDCIHCLKGTVKFPIRSANSATGKSTDDKKIRFIPTSGTSTPGVPTDVKLELISGGSMALSLKPSLNRLMELGYYLLKITQDAYPRTYTNFALLNLTDVGYVELIGSKFIYSCIKIQPGTERVDAQIWPLSTPHTTTVKNLEYSSSIRATPLLVSKEYLRGLARCESCICNATVYITPSVPTPPGNVIMYRVEIKKFKQTVPVVIDLVGNSTILQTWKFFNKTSFRLQTETLNNGLYHLQVRRNCGDCTNYNLWCSQEEAAVSVSPYYKLTVPKDPWSIYTDPRGIYTDPWNNNTDLQATRIHADQLDDVFRVAAAAVITCLIFASILLFTGFSIKCFHDERRRRHLPEPRFVGARHIFKQRIATKIDIKGHRLNDVEDETISIVYTKDSAEHVRRVERLNVALQQRGIRSETIDENTKGADLMGNLIDFGEKIATGSRAVIFVISPVLHAMCQVGHTPQPQHIVDERMLDTFHRLPAVVLNSLKIRLHLLNKKGPQLFVVNCRQDCDETKIAFNAFVSNHGSLFNSNKQWMFLNNDENSLDYKNVITKLATRLRKI